MKKILLAILFVLVALFGVVLEHRLRGPSYVIVQKDVEARQSQLLSLAKEYETCEGDIQVCKVGNIHKFKDVIESLENQKVSIKHKIVDVAKSLGEDEIPPSIQKYLK